MQVIDVTRPEAPTRSAVNYTEKKLPVTIKTLITSKHEINDRLQQFPYLRGVIWLIHKGCEGNQFYCIYIAGYSGVVLHFVFTVIIFIGAYWQRRVYNEVLALPSFKFLMFYNILCVIEINLHSEPFLTN